MSLLQSDNYKKNNSDDSSKYTWLLSLKEYCSARKWDDRHTNILHDPNLR